MTKTLRISQDECVRASRRISFALHFRKGTNFTKNVFFEAQHMIPIYSR